MNIERIARAMVDVEPSADLEARIRARIDATRPAQTTGWWSWKVWVPAGAAAALALAFVIQSPTSRVQNPESRVQGSATTVPQSASGVLVSDPVPNSAASVVTSRRSRTRTASLPKLPTSQLSPDELAWMERRVAALNPVNALEVDRLQLPSIQPEPLAITPLTMTPVGTDGAGSERRNDR